MSGRVGNLLTTCANWVIKLVGAVIFAALAWYAFRFTQYMIPKTGYEYPVDVRDSEVANLLAVLLLCVAAWGLNLWERKLSERWKTRIQRIVLGVAMLWQGIRGYLWIASADRVPTGDQGSVYYSALEFLGGDYTALLSGSYCGLFPHQLGFVSLEEGMFRLTGITDYHMLQFLFAGMMVLELFFAYRILMELTERFCFVVLGTVLGGLSMLSVFYSSWIYGEVPYVFFSMLAAWMLAAYTRRKQGGYLILFVASVTMAMLVRENALIFITAFALVAFVQGIVQKDRKLLVAVVCAVALPILCYQGIFQMYELRSGIPHSDGMPSNDYVYIGLVETDGRYGWDYYPSTQVYYDNDTDSKRTEEAVNVLLTERFQDMISDPAYFFLFFKGKILSQWNAPMYQALYFTFAHEEVHLEKAAAFLDSLSTDRFFDVLWLADRLQFVLYFGMLCYFVFSVKRDSDLLRHLLAVTIIGGFLFSVIWEAKTRYIFPYYMMMFPVAMDGYRSFWSFVEKRYHTLRRN